MKVDYHLHTSRCGHATGSMEEYLAVAEKKGLDEIGFSDHFPLELLGFIPDNPVNMQPQEITDYIHDVKRLALQATIPVRLAAEVDFLPGRVAETAKALASYKFDYVIGSVHFLDGWDFTHPEREREYQTKDIDALYANYFTLIQELAASNLFDIVGHLDVIKKFAYFPRKSWSHIVDETCRILKVADICVEFNTSGWRAPVKEAYPGVFFLEKCHDLGIPVTLGSDAHNPQDVGSGLQRAALILSKIGYREIATFCERKRTMCPLF